MVGGIIKSHWYFSFLFYLLLLSTSAFANASPEQLNSLMQNTSQSIETIDHSKWQYFLDRYIKVNADGITRVDYAAVNKEDRLTLKEYLKMLKSLPLANYNSDEQRAYWINLYNATVVDTVLDHYPIISIKEINQPAGKLDQNPWVHPCIKINNTHLSLHQIRVQLLQQQWPDARLHYVLNKGTIGSPNLPTTAFTASNTETLLNQAAIQFVNSLRGVQIINNRLVTNDMYRIHMNDFGGNHQKIIDHITSYADEPLKTQLKQVHRIDKTIYNWHLNDVHHRHYS